MGGREVDEAEAALADAVRQRSAAKVAEIVALRDRAPLLTESLADKGKRRTPVQKAREELLHEAGKKRYVLSLRGFVRQFAGQGLMEALYEEMSKPDSAAMTTSIQQSVESHYMGFAAEISRREMRTVRLDELRRG